MTNEQIVSQVKKGISVTENMQLLYEKNLSLIKKFIHPYIHYESEEDLLQEAYFGLWEVQTATFNGHQGHIIRPDRDIPGH